MRKKHFILSIIIATLLFVSPMAFAVEFGPNSAKITNRYFPATVGDWSYKLGFGTFAGSGSYGNVVGVEEVSGAQIEMQTFDNVKCLKINIIQTSLNDVDEFISIWMAQDTDGNLWVLKGYSHFEDETFMLGTAIKSMFMPAVPTVGDPAGIIAIEDPAHTYCQVDAAGIPVNTKFGSYSGCIKSICLYNSSIESVEYYCPDEGEVRTTKENTSNPQNVLDLKEYGNATVTRAVVIPLMD